MPFIERPIESLTAPQPIPSAQGDDADSNDTGKPPVQEPSEGPVRTQMVGETPEDDLGYDPNLIPTEPIEDDD